MKFITSKERGAKLLASAVEFTFVPNEMPKIIDTYG